MRFSKRIGVVLGMFAGLLLASTQANATDIPIFPNGPSYALTSLVWGTSTQPGFNNNFFFVPLNTNESVCVFVYNNNPTSSHTFFSSILITANTNEKTPSDGTWQVVASSATQSLIVNASPSVAAGIGAQVSGTALVSVNFSLSTTQAGSPDTATVFILQTTGACPGGGQFLNGSQILATAPIQGISDGLSSSFSANTSTTNPSTNVDLLSVSNAGVGLPKNIYFDHVTISCSATCSFVVSFISTLGTGCSAVTVNNLKIGVGSAATAVVQSIPCTGQPVSGQTMYTLDLAANTPITLDLRGAIAASGNTQGLAIETIAALTGVIKIGMFWYEK